MRFEKGTFIQTTDAITGHTFEGYLKKDIEIKDYHIELWENSKAFKQYMIKQTSTFLIVHN